MDAWQIFGWLLNAIAATILGTALYTIWTLGAGEKITRWFREGWRHHQTYRIEPKVGQVWSQDGMELEITSVENGRVCMRNRWTNMVWCDSPYQWEQRVMEHRMWLIGESNAD